MIYTECKPDSTLVKILGIAKKEIVHLGGKPEVCKQLKKRKDCKGLVDEDPFSIQPPYLKKLETKKNLSDYGLKLLKDNSNNNDLIILCPRLEEWVLKASKEANIDIRRYNLPDDATALHELINTNLDKFEILLEDMKDCNRLKNLKKLLLKGN